MIKIKEYSDLSSTEIYQIFQSRINVFVVEQECIYQDIDNKDIDAFHCFIKDDLGNDIIAYLRILKKGVSYKEAPSIGRVLVTEPYRKQGYATAIMNEAIDYIFYYLNESKIIISAQEYLIKFYSSLGFVQIGDVYLEDNIPHTKMIKIKKDDK